MKTVRFRCIGNGSMTNDHICESPGAHTGEYVSVADVVNLLNELNVELCALVPDPHNPDFTAALRANNPADNECLQSVLRSIRIAMADLKLEVVEELGEMK